MPRVTVTTLLALAAGTPALAQPDLIAGRIDSVQHYAQVGGIHAYSFGATACNLGADSVQFNDNSNQHPVIAQHLYRVADGRLEQIGLSWVLHTFAALQSGACATCSPAAGFQLLGPGCSTTDSAGILGSQPGLGPRFEINAATGDFEFPFSNPAGETGDSIFKRLQVPAADLVISPDIQYIAELQYVTPDDAPGQATNNASYRLVTLQPNFNLTVNADTQRERSALVAWADLDPDVVVETFDVPGDGRFEVAAKVSYLGDRMWRYHYSLHNLNSHRSAAGIYIPALVPQVSDPDFHAPQYHSGSPVDNAPWDFFIGNASVAWFTQAHTPENDLSANALRWGTTYTFSITAPSAPTTSEVQVDLFRPGSPTSFLVPLPTPGVVCHADFAEPFGTLDFSDVVAFLSSFAAMNPGSDLVVPFGVWDFSDVVAFLAAFGSGCP